MLTQTMKRRGRGLGSVLCALALGAAGGVAGAPGLQASSALAVGTSYECNLPTGGYYFPVCVVDPGCADSSFIKTYHSVAWPYQLWVGTAGNYYRWYYGSHSTFAYIFPTWPSSVSGYAQTVNRSGSTVARFHAGTYGCS